MKDILKNVMTGLVLLAGLFFVGHLLNVTFGYPLRFMSLEPMQTLLNDVKTTLGVDFESCKQLKQSDDKLAEDYSTKLILPVNVSAKSSKRIRLVINVSDEYRPVYSSDFFDRNGLQEYFPKKDKSINSWSELITIQKSIGQSISSSQAIELMKHGILSGDPNAEMIFAETVDHENHSHSLMTVLYVFNGRKEVVVGDFYSGPYDCVGLQYAIALNSDVSLENALVKINLFLENNVQLVDY